MLRQLHRIDISTRFRYLSRHKRLVCNESIKATTTYMNRIREQFLLHRIRSKRDAKAYAELYDVYVQRIYRFIYLKVPSKQDAEELTAETFTGAWTYFTGEVVHSAGALLYRIARYRIADFYRSRRVQEVELDAEHTKIPDRTDASEDVAVSEDMRRVRAVLKSMHLEYAQIITMRYLDELDIPEIAKALGKTANNVRVTLHRAMAALQTELLKKEDRKP